MKELSIEQKAQRYDEALERANVAYKDEDRHLKATLERIFPELAESEDEKIRKELLEHCKNQAEPYIQTGNECPQIQSWIVWLEKQEQKPTDEDMKTLLRTEYEKGRADAIAEMQKGWSEEDSYYRNCIIQIIEEIKNAPLKRLEDWDAYIDWLKSLGPQNKWKPSDEQMRVFDLAIRCGINRGTTEETTLISLFNDLKKLTE